MNVELISYTELGELACGVAAKTCTSEHIPDMTEYNYDALEHALESGHDSVAEHWTATFAIEGISRACSHQLVRHRMASYCVSADTKIRTSSQKTNGKTIRELYELPPQYFKNLKVRCVDDDGNIKYNHPEAIVYSGVKPTYTVKTVHGYEIRTTKEHRFLTESGWKALEDIEVGERVYINGQNSYKDRDWLYEMYHGQNLSQQEIADICGVSKDCIRAWVHKHGIQKEMGSWSIGVEPCNKGKTKADYEPMRRTSEKMMGNHNPSMFRHGKDKIGSWKDEGLSESGLRGRTAREIYPMRKNVCDLCGFRGVTEFHHMNKNLYEYNTNIVELCVSCHKAIHRKEITQRIVLSEIVSINYYGNEDTYDIMMPDPYHNFIADGFVVHNSQQSQRYVKMDGFELVYPQSVMGASGAESGWERDGTIAVAIKDYLSDLKWLVDKLRKANIPEEDIRYFYPNATKTNIVVTMNARELRHFFSLRCCERAQWEIKQLAEMMLALVKEVAPTLFEDAGSRCKQMGYCPEKRGCGKMPKKVSA